jgi:hypothetical protein
MRIFHLARRPPQWLRVILAGLLFGFALNSIAHVTHQHEAASPTAVHGPACGYCVSFGALAAAPQHNHALPTVEPLAVRVAAALDVPFSARPLTSAHPRAPPTR